jgi:hypothetical protein
MSATMYPAERMIVEIVAAILCFVIMYFMEKPYKLTREGSYLGLPLGFAFLGISYALAALAYSPLSSDVSLMWPPQVTRTFAFVFLAITYLFSNWKSKSSKLLGEITISLLIIVATVLFLLAFVAPQFSFGDYSLANAYLRIFNVICLSYVSVCTLRSHVHIPDPTTIWIPFGFIFLAISQYSLIFWYIGSSFSAFIGSLVVGFMGLIIFLFVAYRTFYSPERERG